MRAIRPLTALALGVVTFLMSQQTPGLGHGNGLYPTEAEAQKRAAEIGCSSVHENNGRWMPCADERELHQKLRQLHTTRFAWLSLQTVDQILLGDLTNIVTAAELTMPHGTGSGEGHHKQSNQFLKDGNKRSVKNKASPHKLSRSNKKDEHLQPRHSAETSHRQIKSKQRTRA